MFGAAKDGLVDVKNGLLSMFYAPPTESRFIQEGKLTPEEFVISGDSLISMCPSWKWMPASSDKYVNKYLPPNKQYLLMEKVPCDQRVRELMDSIQVNAQEIDDEYVINDNKTEEEQNPGNFIETKIGTLSVKESIPSGDGTNDGEDDEDNVVVVEAPVERRFYDLALTYDLVQFTPHLYFSGINEDNIPLKQDQIFEDVVSHYSNKTVTFQAHPQTGINQASLHPCKHSQVIKHMIDNIQEAGGVIKSHQCLFIFLKFLQSVIPTIQFDIAGEILFDQ